MRTQPPSRFDASLVFHSRRLPMGESAARTCFQSSLRAAGFAIAVAACFAGCAQSRVRSATGEGGANPGAAAADAAGDQSNATRLPAGTSTGAGGNGVDRARAPRLLLTTSNFVQGETYFYDPDSGEVSEPVVNADQDTIPDYALGRFILLERTLGALRVAKQDDPLVTETVIELERGDMLTSPNPQQVVATADGAKAYVVELGRNRLTVLGQGSDGTLAVDGAVDLSPLVAPGDRDGLVDAVGAFVVSPTRLAVILGRYDFDANFQMGFPGPALIALVDTDQDVLIDLDEATPGIQGIALEGTNPSQAVIYDPASSLAFVHMRGPFGAGEGAVESVDFVTNQSRGIVLREGELTEQLGAPGTGGGSATLFTVVAVGPEQSYLQLGSQVFGWNPLSGALGPAPLIEEIDGFSGQLFANSNGVHSWRRTNPNQGLRSFQVGTNGELNERVAGAMPVVFGDFPIYGIASAP